MFKQLTIPATVIAALATPALACASETPNWRVHIDPETGEFVGPNEMPSQTSSALRFDGLEELPERAPAKLPGSDREIMESGPIGGTLMTPPDHMRSDFRVHINDAGEIAVAGDHHE